MQNEMKMVYPRRNVLSAMAMLTAPLWIEPVGWYLAWHSWSPLNHLGMFLLFMAMMCFLFACYFIVNLAISLLKLFFTKNRRRSAIAAGRSAVFITAFIGGMLIGRVVWHNRVSAFAARSTPLVAAVHAYCQDNGRPPGSLAELAPRYLREIPTTGIGAYPDFHYRVGEEKHFDGNLWVIQVTAPSRPPMSFDSILYFPMQNYPQFGYGGVLEPIGDWAYVHE